jgi:hypothetical protein
VFLFKLKFQWSVLFQFLFFISLSVLLCCQEERLQEKHFNFFGLEFLLLIKHFWKYLFGWFIKQPPLFNKFLDNFYWQKLRIFPFYFFLSMVAVYYKR